MLKKYINKLFNKYQIIKNNNNPVFSKDHIKKFIYFASAFANKRIEILTSKDTTGGYFATKIILPKELNIFKTSNYNYNYYLYKIIFFLYLNKLIIKKKYNTDYLIMSFILTIKQTRRNIKNDNLHINNLEKLIYPTINELNLNTKDRKITFLQIIIEKLIYSSIKRIIILTHQEKLFLYKLENLINIKNEGITALLNKAYIYFTQLYSSNNNNIHHPWGSSYYYNDNVTNISKSKISTNKIKKTIKKINININKEKLNNTTNMPLEHLFNYKQTLDNYKRHHNKAINNNDGTEIKYMNSTNSATMTKSSTESHYLIKNDALNNSTSFCMNYHDFKKYEYDEWDFNLDIYKKNWCKLYEKKDILPKEMIWHKDFIKNNINIYKKLILLFREKLLLVKNKKEFIKRQKWGQDIDLDTIIDNYKDVKNYFFDKVYTQKIKKRNDSAVILLLDSSLSMESYLNTIKKISFIKILALVLSLTLEKIISYEVSTFHSNTRHDCRYLRLKDFSDNINKKKYNILNILSSGYTRIGPAIRHAANILNKRTEREKIIILLTDGCPTDYDEYEGTYGIQDIKNAMTEILKKKIKLKNIITNNTPNITFLNIIGNKNYTVINNISYISIMKILTLCFKLKI